MPLVSVGAVVKLRVLPAVPRVAPPTKLATAPAAPGARLAALTVRLPPVPLVRLTVENPAWTVMVPNCWVGLALAVSLPGTVTVPPAGLRAVAAPRRLMGAAAAVSSILNRPPTLTVKAAVVAAVPAPDRRAVPP